MQTMMRSIRGKDINTKTATFPNILRTSRFHIKSHSLQPIKSPNANRSRYMGAGSLFECLFFLQSHVNWTMWQTSKMHLHDETRFSLIFFHYIAYFDRFVFSLPHVYIEPHSIWAAIRGVFFFIPFLICYSAQIWLAITIVVIKPSSTSYGVSIVLCVFFHFIACKTHKLACGVWEKNWPIAHKQNVKWL